MASRTTTTKKIEKKVNLSKKSASSTDIVFSSKKIDYDVTTNYCCWELFTVKLSHLWLSMENVLAATIEALRFIIPSEELIHSLGEPLGIPADIPIQNGLYLAVAFTFYRYGFQYVASRILEGSVPQTADKKAVAYKASESAFKFMYYTFSWIWAVVIIYDLGIWSNTLKCIEDFPYERNYSISGYILWELAYYVSGLGCHFTIETPRKDFVEMAIHHVVTIVLITSCIVFRLERIGLLVLVVHDVADIFLESGKLCNYLGMEGGSTGFFVLIIITWLISRLYYFPFKVIRSVYYEHYLMFDAPYCFYFTWLLCVLLVLHVYWFFLILKSFRKSLKTGGKEVDAREYTTTSSKKKT
jgi:hypothetical protein